MLGVGSFPGLSAAANALSTPPGEYDRKAVSYTHLIGEGASLKATLTVNSGRGYVPADQNKKDDAPVGTPVSYTHLDVYKRQVSVHVRKVQLHQTTNVQLTSQ